MVVAVRAPDGNGCRFDVWDMGLEKLVYTSQLDGVRCNPQGFVGLGDCVIWTLADDAVHRIELPVILEPIDACEHAAEAPSEDDGVPAAAS
jgi:hypothetical protein